MSLSVNQENIQKLRQIAAFSHLETEELEQLLPVFHLKNVKPQQTIISSAESNTDVYFIVSGKVRAIMYAPSGREISYQDIADSNMFGEMAAIDQMERTTSVVAIDDTVLLRLSSNKFIEVISKYPSVGLATLRKVVSVNRFLCERVYEYGALDVNNRVRSELVRLAKKGTENADGEIVIENMPTHQELANRLATHREAVTRELNYLSKNNLIKKEKNRFSVIDIEGLESLVWG